MQFIISLCISAALYRHFLAIFLLSLARALLALQWCTFEAVWDFIFYLISQFIKYLCGIFGYVCAADALLSSLSSRSRFICNCTRVAARGEKIGPATMGMGEWRASERALQRNEKVD
jgi:hypothetical protein